MTFSNLQPTLLTDRVYEVLHQAIITGELQAGARLRVRDLAEQVGTSVMPVREAIRRLEEAGFAERQPHKGAVVKGLTLAELLHVYDVRLLLEGEAARLGAARITAEECDLMEAKYDAMLLAIREKRVVDLLDHDEAMLDILYAASGNPVLVSLIRTLWERCRAYKIVGARGTLHLEDDDSLERYQKDILAAARKRDPEEARAVSDASLHNATQRIRDRLALQETAAQPG